MTWWVINDHDHDLNSKHKTNLFSRHILAIYTLMLTYIKLRVYNLANIRSTKQHLNYGVESARFGCTDKEDFQELSNSLQWGWQYNYMYILYIYTFLRSGYQTLTKSFVLLRGMLYQHIGAACYYFLKVWINHTTWQHALVYISMAILLASCMAPTMPTAINSCYTPYDGR